MKKDNPFRDLFYRSLKKTLLIMRIAISFLLLGILQAHAVDAYSQKTRLSLDFTDTELIKVLDNIEVESEFYFLYNEKLLDTDRKVNITADNQLITNILDNLFAGTDVAYSIIDRKIILAPEYLTKEKDEYATMLQQVVTGTVTDSQTGEAMPGVNIQVKGTSIGTITDADGKYSISVTDRNAIITFSFIGYIIQEIPLNSRTALDVYLEVEVASLSEVIVIGYGRTTRENLTSSTSVINTSSIIGVPQLRVDQMLQGKASGMMVTQVNGSPGAASSIRIRGNSSITASSEPLFVVDGLLGGGDLSTINPADIAEISVLKDATATAIYGSRGANGVILITTKRGTVGQNQISANIQNGWQWLPRKIDLITGSQYAELLNESRLAMGSQPVYEDPESVQTVDWQEEVMQTAPSVDANISMKGGNDRTRYFLSANYFNQNGIIKRTGVERIQFRINLDNKIKDKLRIGLDMNAGNYSTDNNTVPLSPQYSLLTTVPSMAIYNEDGTYNYTYPHPNFNGRFNTPVASLYLRTSQNSRSNLVLNSFAEYSLFDWITFKTTFGGQLLSFSRSNSYTDSRLPGQTTNQQFGTASISYSDGIDYQNENTISFTRQLNNNHFVDGIVGITFQGGNGQSANASAQKFISDATMWNNLAAGDPITRTIGSTYQNWSMVSYLARLTYKYKGRYLITAIGREDGSSRLGAGNKWVFFPSLALGWIASEESFIKDLNIFSLLKLRASYGMVGNQSVGIYQTMSILTSINSVVNGIKVSGWAPGKVSGSVSIVGNPNLKWETKKQLDLGLDAYFFKDRLSLTLDFYHATTNDLLLLIEVPSQIGYTQRMSNVGQVRNTGFEININTTNIESPKFTWTTQFNLAYNKNKILKLGPTGADIVTHNYTWGVRPVGILRIGEPVGSFFGYVSDGIWKENQGATSHMAGALAGSPRYKDVVPDGKLNQSDCVILGKGSPDWYGGLGNYVAYKGFGLNLFFSGSLGAKIFNGNAAFLRSTDAQYNHYPEVLDRWHPTDNPDSDVPGALNVERETYPSDRWIFKASYLRLESVNLTFNIPLSERIKEHITSAAINLTGLNLFCISPYNKWGWDPVINQTGGSDLGYNNSLQGFDYGAYPKASTLAIGVNFVF